MPKILRIASRRRWRKVRDDIIKLQRALPKSNDPEAEALRTNLYRARVNAEGLMTRFG